MRALGKESLRGSFPPLVTPLRNGEVDYDTYAKLVDFQAREGSHGIVVTGTTGEPSTLSTAERIQLVKVAVEAAAGRIEVVAASGGQSYADTMEMSTAAARSGADALLVVTPFFIRPPARGLVEYYRQIGHSADLPLMIYHIPGRAAVSMTVDTIAEVAERTPSLVGIKHAANDLTLVSDLLMRLGRDFRVHVGLEDLSFPMLAMGASGLMNAVGNIVPRKVAELYERSAAGDMRQARELHFALHELNQSVFFDINPIPMKYMMRRVGLLPVAEHRLPMMPATMELASRLDDVLRRAGLLA
jgi:4-hydroxy-tetrahydrodipicolinate synthase